MTRTYKKGRTDKQWIKDNAEHIKEYRKQYRERNKEKIRMSEKEYYQRHKNEICEKERKKRIPYRDLPEERKERIRKNNRKYYEKRRQQRSDYNKRYRWVNGEKIAIAKRKHWLTYRYGITPEQYQHILNSQSGVCAICHMPENRPNKNLAVDHNHKTGKVRGLLCDKCNRALGYFDENLDSMMSAMQYLQSNL